MGGREAQKRNSLWVRRVAVEVSGHAGETQQEASGWAEGGHPLRDRNGGTRFCEGWMPPPLSTGDRQIEFLSMKTSSKSSLMKAEDKTDSKGHSSVPKPIVRGHKMSF